MVNAAAAASSASAPARGRNGAGRAPRTGPAMAAATSAAGRREAPDQPEPLAQIQHAAEAQGVLGDHEPGEGHTERHVEGAQPTTVELGQRDDVRGLQVLPRLVRIGRGEARDSVGGGHAVGSRPPPASVRRHRRGRGLRQRHGGAPRRAPKRRRPPRARRLGRRASAGPRWRAAARSQPAARRAARGCAEGQRIRPTKADTTTSPTITGCSQARTGTFRRADDPGGTVAWTPRASRTRWGQVAMPQGPPVLSVVLRLPGGARRPQTVRGRANPCSTCPVISSAAIDVVEI